METRLATVDQGVNEFLEEFLRPGHDQLAGKADGIVISPCKQGGFVKWPAMAIGFTLFVQSTGKFIG